MKECAMQWFGKCWVIVALFPIRCLLNVLRFQEEIWFHQRHLIRFCWVEINFFFGHCLQSNLMTNPQSDFYFGQSDKIGDNNIITFMSMYILSSVDSVKCFRQKAKSSFFLRQILYTLNTIHLQYIVFNSLVKWN